MPLVQGLQVLGLSCLVPAWSYNTPPCQLLLTTAALPACCSCPSCADNNLLVKYVLFNNTSYDWWLSYNTPNSNWVSIALHSHLSDFIPDVPIDLVITVRGNQDELCPAPLFMYTNNTCEYALHGRDGDYQCCPHGITPPAPPPDQCCVDDLTRTPYRLDFVRAQPTNASTKYLFAVSVVTPPDTDHDGEEAAVCDQMTLDWASIQLCEWG